MHKIYIKLFFILLPILLLTAIYFINDPFKVLYHYRHYYAVDGKQYVTLNDDYVATETFLSNYPSHPYDSYIFGSSRGLLFHIPSWQKHVDSGSHCFQFAVSNESLYGMERKFHLIDSMGGQLKNALIVFDKPLLSVTAENEKFPKDPVLSGKSKIGFEINSFKGFFEADFLTSYISLLITHKAKTGIWHGALNNSVRHYDTVTNDVSYPGLDASIDADTAAFYNARKQVFFERSKTQVYNTPMVKPEQIVLLKRIKNVLDKHHTSYKIVMSPLYDQLRTDTTDMRILSSIFGAEHIYDYSGINDITASKYNYYESSHFRPFIADRIMDSIYADKPMPVVQAK